MTRGRLLCEYNGCFLVGGRARADVAFVKDTGLSALSENLWYLRFDPVLCAFVLLSAPSISSLLALLLTGRFVALLAVCGVRQRRWFSA